MTSPTVRRYIAIDLGTDSGKVILATVTDGRPELETVHSFPMHTTRMAGKNFWNIYSIFDEVLCGLSKIGARRIQIESIGVDSWSSDFVCVADDGSFIGLPRSGYGTVGGSVREKFFKKITADDYYSTTGIQIQDSCTAIQLFAQYKEKNLALENARSLLFISDALVYLLTGKRICDRTQLSAAGLMNVRKGKIAKDVLKVSHIKPKRFHPFVDPGTKIARITDEIAAATGLEKINVVTVAGSSTASSVYALPIEEEGSAFLYVGPEAYMGIETAAPIINDRMKELDMSNECSVGGKYLVCKHIFGMRAFEACLSEWSRKGKVFSREEIQAMLGMSASSAALLDFGDPALAPQKDMLSAISRYCTSKEMSVPSGETSVMRLVYDSFADSCGDLFRKLQGISPFRIKSLYVSGPYSTDAFLNRLLAGECGVPVIAVPGDTAAIGNVAVQAGLTRAALSKNIETQFFRPETSLR